MKRLAIPALLLTIALMPAAAEALNGAVLPPVTAHASTEQAFRAEFTGAATRFYDPLFTGWMHNAIGKNCDDWDDWMLGWLRTHERGTVLGVEEVFFYRRMDRQRWYWPSAHVAVRVTLKDGAVFYLDPWRYGPERAVRPRAEYEGRWGLPDAVYAD
ncbi:hypothetical protein SAMN05216486_10323 [bacterium JGI 053]|nr:hypothetical protein SAMN05216486_10323 [bacterium JGI 053]